MIVLILLEWSLLCNSNDLSYEVDVISDFHSGMSHFINSWLIWCFLGCGFEYQNAIINVTSLSFNVRHESITLVRKEPR